jgi:hypothetical protein
MSIKKNRKYVLLWLGVFFSTVLFLSGCSRATGKRTVYPASSVNADAETVLEGVVVSNEDTAGQITLRELDSDIETVISYDATAQITDKYGNSRDGEEIEQGEILEVTYSAYSGKVLSAVVPDDVWEYQDVKEYDFDSEESSLEFAERKYQYSTTTYFSSGDQSIQMMEIGDQDVLTIRGKGYKVYSVTRTEGHGYVRLAHYDDFVGGVIEVGSSLILTVTPNMLITVREGTYKVILSKGRNSAVKNVTVKKDEEVTLDFSDYEPADSKVGVITFDIEPAGADLTINSTAVSYKKPIALAYGVYEITVSMTGYTQYSGQLDVEGDDTVTINLVEEKTSVSESTPSPSSGSDASSSDTSTDTTVTKQIDSDHTITISAPEGAEVYLDNVYKGLTPCTFTKVIGSQTITLRKDGYTTKSYSVDVIDDDDDIKLSFPEMVASDDTQTTAAP